jgi:hypothetical protein
VTREPSDDDRPTAPIWKSVRTAGALAVATLFIIVLLSMIAAALGIDIPNV